MFFRIRPDLTANALRRHYKPSRSSCAREGVPLRAPRASAKPAAAKPAANSREEEALRITKEIRRTLKDIAIGHIHAGRLLAQMRDEKLYTALGYKTIEAYAKDRFGFASSTLYKHIRAYEWVRANRPDWLTDNPKGTIPDHSDLQDLIWIDGQLQKPKLADTTRAKLEALKAKAFEGKLRQKELAEYKRHGNESNTVRKALLASIRAIRRRVAKWNEMPPKAMRFLEQIIAILSGKTTAG